MKTLQGTVTGSPTTQKHPGGVESRQVFSPRLQREVNHHNPHDTMQVFKKNTDRPIFQDCKRRKQTTARFTFKTNACHKPVKRPPCRGQRVQLHFHPQAQSRQRDTVPVFREKASEAVLPVAHTTQEKNFSGKGCQPQGEPRRRVPRRDVLALQSFSCRSPTRSQDGNRSSLAPHSGIPRLFPLADEDARCRLTNAHKMWTRLTMHVAHGHTRMRTPPIVHVTCIRGQATSFCCACMLRVEDACCAVRGTGHARMHMEHV